MRFDPKLFLLGPGAGEHPPGPAGAVPVPAAERASTEPALQQGRGRLHPVVQRNQPVASEQGQNRADLQVRQELL